MLHRHQRRISQQPNTTTTHSSRSNTMAPNCGASHTKCCTNAMRSPICKTLSVSSWVCTISGVHEFGSHLAGSEERVVWCKHFHDRPHRTHTKLSESSAENQLTHVQSECRHKTTQTFGEYTNTQKHTKPSQIIRTSNMTRPPIASAIFDTEIMRPFRLSYTLIRNNG